MLSAAVSLHAAQDAAWKGGGSDRWDDPANWDCSKPLETPQFPDGADAVARFVGTEGSGSIRWGKEIVAGHLRFEHTNTEIVASGPDQNLVFSVLAGNAAIESLDSKVHICPRRFVLASGVEIVNQSENILDLQGGLTGSGDLIIAKGGPVRLIHQHHFPLGTPFTGQLVIQEQGQFFVSLSSEPPVVFGALSGKGSLLDVSPRCLIGSSNQNTTFEGKITSQNRFVKVGTGTLTLTGMNSFNNLAIRNGAVSVASMYHLGTPSILELGGEGTATLQCTGGGSLHYGGDVILSSEGGVGILEIGPATSLTLEGVVSGPGSMAPLCKRGSGELRLTNANTYRSVTLVPEGTLTLLGRIVGNAIVNGGNLIVFGRAEGSTTVANHGQLRGTGHLHQVRVESAGVLAPGDPSGNPIGAISIDELTLLPGAETRIAIHPGAVSQIQVGSVATLAGSVRVLPQTGDYGVSGRYPILTALGGISGFFNETVLGGMNGYALNLELVPAANTVYLAYQFQGIPAVAEPPSPVSQYAVYLSQNVPVSPVTGALLNLDQETLLEGLSSASPLRNAIAPFAAQNTMFAWSLLVANHLASQRFFHGQTQIGRRSVSFFEAQERALLLADASEPFQNLAQKPAPIAAAKHSFWIGSLGELAKQKALDHNPAFHFYIGGGLLGIDFYGEKNLFGVGAGGSYTHVIEDKDAGRVKIGSYFATLYDTIYGPPDFPMHLEFGAWGVYNQIHNERHISFPGVDATAAASFASWQLVPHFGLGYRAEWGCFSFDPFAQFDLAVDWQEGFQEKGAGAYSVRQAARNSQFLRSEGGFAFCQTKETSWGAWLIQERISYVNKKSFGTGSVSASIAGTSALFHFETYRNVQNLGAAGLEFLWRKGDEKPLSFSLAYTGEFGSEYQSQTATFRFVKDF